LANHYLEKIHTFISQEIRKIETRVVTASKTGDLRSVRFYEGQLVELNAARAYLSENFDLATYSYY